MEEDEADPARGPTWTPSRLAELDRHVPAGWLLRLISAWPSTVVAVKTWDGKQSKHRAQQSLPLFRSTLAQLKT
jgi:hypothetical protein